tara:strand:+ start:467 stop:1249 length:783 start_codon:yes stop_codon:yes gene_type:complete
MENYVNQVLDLPKMVGDKLPGNVFNSMVDDSEGNIAKWTGMFYRVAAFVLVVGAIYGLISPLWDADVSLGEGKEMIGGIVSMLIYIYAVFPIAQVVRSTGDSLGSSSSSTMNFVFKDLIVANIKMIGHVLAIMAFFGAFCMGLSWLTDMDISGGIGTAFLDNVIAVWGLPMTALVELTSMLGLDFVGAVIADNWMNWDVTTMAGDAWSWSGLVAVAWEFAGVALLLAKLYVSLTVYHFMYGLLTTFVAWIKSPYLPFRSK